VPASSRRAGRISLPAALPGLPGSPDAALECADGLHALPGVARPWRSQRDASCAVARGDAGPASSSSSRRLPGAARLADAVRERGSGALRAMGHALGGRAQVDVRGRAGAQRQQRQHRGAGD